METPAEEHIIRLNVYVSVCVRTEIFFFCPGPSSRHPFGRQEEAAWDAKAVMKIYKEVTSWQKLN